MLWVNYNTRCYELASPTNILHPDSLLRGIKKHTWETQLSDVDQT